MPGIFGAVIPDDQDGIAPCLDSMAATLMHRDWYTQSDCVTEQAGLGVIGLDQTSGVAQIGDVTLSYYGNIVDTEALRAALTREGVHLRESVPLPHLLLQSYLHFGRKPLEQLNGYYAVALWDASTRKLTLLNDRGGDVKIHYWHNRSNLIFAPESKAISWHPAFQGSLDTLAAYELFALTFPLEDRTLFRDIRILKPGHVLRFQDGDLTTERYHRHGTEAVEASDAPLEVYADGYYERLRGAVEKRLGMQENTGIFLTGGLDSRVMAGLMKTCAPDTRFQAITSGDPAGHDMKFAGKVARACGFHHHTVRVGADYLPRFAREAIRRSEGQTTSHVCWAIASDPLAEEHGLRSMMNGYLGCGNVNAAFPDDYNADAAFGLMLDRAFCGLQNEGRLKEIVRPEVYDAAHGVSVAGLRKQFDDMNEFDTSVRCEILRKDEQHRRFIGIDLELQGAVSQLQYPYTDNEVWDYLLNIPMPFRRGKAFFLNLIERHFPKLAATPRSGPGVPIAGNCAKRLFHRGKQRVYHRILPRVSGGRLGGRNLEKGVFYSEWQRTGSRAFVLDTLAKTHLYDDILDPAHLSQHVNGHLEGRWDDPGLVHSLISFVLWREQFCS